jgi:hypothetical protein
MGSKVAQEEMVEGFFVVVFAVMSGVFVSLGALSACAVIGALIS